MFPGEFIKRIEGQKYVSAESLLRALEDSSPVSIRINPSKWKKIPENAGSVPWCSAGYYLSNRPSYTLDPLFHTGCYYPQEASGMFLEQAVKQSGLSLNNIRVLDLCGAPGGKSTHLSEIIGPDSLLVANEVIRPRSVILSETVTKWGSGNTLVTRNDPAAFGKLPGFFDIIVVDAPCSGEGMFRNKSAVNEWSSMNTAHCAERQKRILMDIWPALKENGILIYSTCTFNPGENEENIRWLTGKHQSESIRMNIDNFTGITEIGYMGIYGYGFYPDKVRGEGFFVSVVRKTGKQEKSSVRNQRVSELRPGRSEMATARSWTIFSEDRLLRWGDDVFAVPGQMDDYVYLFQNLNIVKAGTKIFSVKKRDYIPSPELALSQYIKKNAFPINEISLDETVSYLRRDNITLHGISKGWSIVTYKGVNAGFINNIGNRINNYFPVEWRIRLDASALSSATAITWQ